MYNKADMVAAAKAAYEELGITGEQRFSVVPDLQFALGTAHRRYHYDASLIDHHVWRRASHDWWSDVDNDMMRVFYTAKRFPADVARKTARQLCPQTLDARYLAKYSPAFKVAVESGLGWIIPTRYRPVTRDGTHIQLGPKIHLVVLVPRPLLVTVHDGVFHDDTGSPAIMWADGTGIYMLNGLSVRPEMYTKIISGELMMQEIIELRNTDFRSIALQYKGVDALDNDPTVELVNVGAKETRLYRTPLTWRRRERLTPDEYGEYDYFIHMRDASHPERQFIEWVDPKVGKEGNAELCQAKAFGISLEQWMSIKAEG